VASLTLDGKPVPVAADGGFFIAFARDSAGEVRLEAVLSEGGSLVRDIDIADFAFPEEHLPASVNARFEADPDFARRRAEEVQRIGAARSTPSYAAGWRTPFIWPVAGRRSGVFGSQRFYGSEPQSPHSGTDIAAPAGATLVAPAGGRVVLASPPEYSLEGNLVILDHGLGLYSAFLHLSRVDVTVGDVLEPGDSIGAVGATGRATGPHLHWGVTWQGVRFDPALLVGNDSDRSVLTRAVPAN
jgi:murein DD-endopeptidase MepM/ murein hydrolase activator NlpD